MLDFTTDGLDLENIVFEAHGADARGRAVKSSERAPFSNHPMKVPPIAITLK